MQTTMDELEMRTLPTLPCSVVWSGGHSYVLEADLMRWLGLDDRGRPIALTPTDLQRRGWTFFPS